jgi:hypothetical protein
MTTILEPLAAPSARLERGRHASPRFGTCVMELASLLAGEEFSDRPASVSPVIGSLLRTYNDGLDDERRQDLARLAGAIVGTAASRSVEANRSSLCLQFAHGLGGAIPSGPAALGATTAEASGALAAVAALRSGPTEEAHARVLELVEQLTVVDRHPRRRFSGRRRRSPRRPARAWTQP